MKELLEVIAKALVDNPDEVIVSAVEGEQVTVFELKVHPNDLGKVIGRDGRTAKSIRVILGAAGMKTKKRVMLEILEEQCGADLCSSDAPKAPRQIIKRV
jgi:predicted RNA-binding protein YlqC (UPF0109 family)